MTAKTYDVMLSDLPLCAAIELRGARATIEQAAAAAALALPAVPNTMAERDGRRVLWLGPDHWLVLAPLADEVDLFARLDGAIGRVGSAVNLSDSFASFRLTGAEFADVLAQGTALDLDPKVFVVGTATRTALGRISALLMHYADGVDIVVDRAYAGYLRGWIDTAMGGVN